MIIGLGIDITELERIEKAWARHGERFAKRILHADELARMPQSAPLNKAQVNFLAARFAAKEAAVKALGTGFSQGIGPCDIEVYSLPTGQPMLKFHGAAAERLAELGVLAEKTHVSLTHGRDTAAAVVILER
ncbi:MAG: holo-[acyl-carrier-protein] synthase [Pseudomonadota bacterium]